MPIAEKVNERVGERERAMGRDKDRGNTSTRARASGLARAANILSRRCRVLIRVVGVCLQMSGQRSERAKTEATDSNASFSVRSPHAIFKRWRLLSARGQEGMARIKKWPTQRRSSKKKTSTSVSGVCRSPSAKWVNSIKRRTNSILYSFVSLIISQPLLFPPD